MIFTHMRLVCVDDQIHNRLLYSGSPKQKVMSEVSLYRKYRPHTFEHLVGQEHVRITLQEAVKKQEVAHAYLFSGPRGTGKTSAARILAKALNCKDIQEGEPCGSCELCERAAEGNLIDLIEIDAASNRGIDEMRDLREKIKFLPTQARKKVYIIDEVHMLTKEAFNALLKTLEEPPEHAHFILATTEVHKVPETILSRCQCFVFHRIDHETLVKRLKYVAEKEKIDIEREVLEMIAVSSEGGLRDALGLLEQMSVAGTVSVQEAQRYLGVAGKDYLAEFYQALNNSQADVLLKKIDFIYREGIEIRQFAKELVSYFRILLLDFVAQGDQPAVRRLINFIEIFQEAEQEMKYATIAQLPLELAVLKACGSMDGSVIAAVAPVSNAAGLSKPEKKALKKSAAKPKQFQEEKPPADGLVEVPKETKHIPLSLKNLKNEWKGIVVNVKPPFLRRSLEQGKIVSVSGQRVDIHFSSEFHLSKVSQTANRQKISGALENVFGSGIELVFELKEVGLSPKMDNEPEITDYEGQEEASKHGKVNNLADQALDIFGGEIVEG